MRTQPHFRSDGETSWIDALRQVSSRHGYLDLLQPRNFATATSNDQSHLHFVLAYGSGGISHDLHPDF